IALSALFPPFEATAPIVLSQLFRSIEERYHGDALQCLLDFLIPAKHLLESVQQAACAGYSDVVFRCEGWPLCLHDKTVIQLAPVNPLLLRPGDFYLQVEPFGDQAARIVLKSLLEEGCREVEETPVPETSYPCIFTEEWLQEINEGRHGTPLSRCLLCTDQGVIKLPWAKIAIPEFLDKPKIMPTYREAPPEPRQVSVPSHFNSSTLPIEAIFLPAKDRMSASLRPADCSSRLVKVDQDRRTPKSCSKPLIKPVGWVSPNTWDSRETYREIEGDYVDLVDIAKEKEFVDKQKGSHPNPANSVLFKPVRPPPPVPFGNSVPCGHTLQYAEEPCTPCSQRKLGHELTDQDLKCRYRDSYMAALRNPVPFERGSVDLLAALEEVGLCQEGGLRSKGAIEAQRDLLGNLCNHSNKPLNSKEQKKKRSVNKDIFLLIKNVFPKPTSCTFKQSHSIQPNFHSAITFPSVRVMSLFGAKQFTIFFLCLSGSRDRTGRAVVEVHGDRKEWTSPLVSAQNVCELLLYLHSIPRREIQELGMTLVINARKKPPPLHLYKALLMAQEQALHAVHSIVMLVDKDTCPRPEKQPGLQMDTVTSMKALNKTVEASQLTSDLGGTFTYSHSDWLQFHQRLVSFMTDLRGADSLLQRAIKKVDDSIKLDSAQEVQQCIQEQRASMKEVLEDTRLVTLQREGGAVLARMRREDFRFPQSEDYRDALESVTSLYNQVEEKLHTLVMRSNESLQRLEFVFRLREIEAKISEQGLKDSHTADDTLEKQQSALTLVTEAEGIVGTSESSPAMDIFRTLVSTFKSNVDDFKLRTEQRYKELDTLVYVHRFCEQASALAKECSHFLEKVEPGCYSAQNLSTLQMYEERLGGEFSTPHFQALKAKACAVGLGASGVMRVWNAALVECREVRQRLEEMQMKKGVDKNQIQPTTAANPQGEDGGIEKREKIKTKLRPREHHSEADLRSTDSVEGGRDVPPHQPLGRSLSEGSHASPYLTSTSSFSPLNVRHKHCQSWTQPLEQNPKPVQNLPNSHNESLQSGNLSCKSKSNGIEDESEGCTASTQSPKDLKTPETLLTAAENNCSNVLGLLISFNKSMVSALFISYMWSRKLRRIMEELLSTEREYVKALGYVREHYFPELERADVPQDLRGQRGSIFGNLEKLHDFHRHHFLNELESCMNEPFRVGRCFLRHRESFALYALYSKNKPQSDSLLINHGQAFFKQKQLALGDKMDLWSYLLKPVQRISKYSLLLQDMWRECGPGQTREMAEVKAALEVIQFQLRHGNNLLAMDAIHHCDVNLKEQGQLIRQDEFLVTFRKKKCFRHIFLFQELVLFSKTRKTDVGNDTYIYKQSFKTSDIGLTQNSGDTGLCFEIWFRKRKTQDTYTLQAVSREVKSAWTKDLERILWEQAVHNREVRMQERVFMGIGNKPFMDIQPSDAAISDRAVNYVLMGRGRPKSLGSGRYVSPPGALEEDDLDQESGSQNLLLDSSESSGESVSGFSSSGHSYHSAIGGEAEDTSSVCASTITVKEAAPAHRAEPSAVSHKPNALAESPEKTPPPVAPKPKPKPQHQAKDVSGGKVQYKAQTTN
uniref:Quattro n=1 Tax=Sparus aurata TaxID=8175 RepID=A0A671XPH5_SPAAU